MPATPRACKLDTAKAGRTTLASGPVSPTRTCVGCGVRAARSELIRVVAAGDKIIPDVAARLPGRGAYLHPSLACLERAQRRRAFTRALRLPAALPDGKLAEYLAALPG